MIDTVAWILRCAQNDQTQRPPDTAEAAKRPLGFARGRL